MSVTTTDLQDVYTAHSAWLQGWLNRRTRCPERAWDLAQDTFCRLLEQNAALAIRDPRPFLAVIARRLLIDDTRRRTLERAYLDAHVHAEDAADLLTPERIAAATQLLNQILNVLSRLSAPSREAFLLRRLDGLTHLQIATRLGVSDRTVKRYIAEAYARCYDVFHGD